MGLLKRILLAALCAVAVAVPGVAAAAPPWSAPQDVSSPALFIDTPDVVYAADGRALATWRRSDARPSPGAAFPTAWRIAVREPGSPTFAPERTAPNLATPLISYGLDRVIALDTRQPGSDESRITLRARFGRSDGTFGAPRTISTYSPDTGSPSLAAPIGAIAAWTAKAPHGRRIVRAALRKGGGFGRPFTLRRRGRAHDVVAGAALGVLFVVWERGGVIEARVKLSGRRSWSRVQRLGRGQPFATSFKVVGSGRRAYVAWLAESEESSVVRVAVLPAASSRFRKAQTLDTIVRSAPAENHPLALVAIPDRDALLAWTGWDGARWLVRAAVTSGGARFGAPFTVSPAGQQSILGDGASVPLGTPLPGGTTMLVWSRLDAVGELGNQVQAAIRPPGGAFGPVEDVSDFDRARIPAVAFDPLAHRWTTVWSQRVGPDGPGVPLSQISTFARASTRPG